MLFHLSSELKKLESIQGGKINEKRKVLHSQSKCVRWIRIQIVWL